MMKQFFVLSRAFPTLVAMWFSDIMLSRLQRPQTKHATPHLASCTLTWCGKAHYLLLRLLADCCSSIFHFDPQTRVAIAPFRTARRRAHDFNRLRARNVFRHLSVMVASLLFYKIRHKKLRPNSARLERWRTTPNSVAWFARIRSVYWVGGLCGECSRR